MTQNHPFEKSTEELKEYLQISQVEGNYAVNNSMEPVTTLAIGEEGGNGFTTEVLGEAGGATTLALGEEGGDFPDATTLAIGEEGGDGMTTEALGEEGGATTLAIGEEGGGFNEEIYLEFYPEVNVAINRGELSSGWEHYLQFGVFEAERIGFFTGTNSNDIITAFGNNNRIIGVNTLGYDLVNDEIIPNSFGVGEIDVLIGSFGVGTTDKFILGFSQESPFYVGLGSFDFALIKNFEVDFDEIQLSGNLDDYSLEIINNSVNISIQSGDLIAIIENLPSLDNLRINFV
ncbi:hypothetical protein [Okeania sp.]|uniref:hypothetical protein n=1 Tax=Okeania sp. TaxID=3100323 RepID=UPI002B4B1410|nr:hypothetical protein [Okeania sp.]MEB3340036.1 hypothetical protein [Okeania sp.]